MKTTVIALVLLLSGTAMAEHKWSKMHVSRITYQERNRVTHMHVYGVMDSFQYALLLEIPRQGSTPDETMFWDDVRLGCTEITAGQDYYAQDTGDIVVVQSGAKKGESGCMFTVENKTE